MEWVDFHLTSHTVGLDWHLLSTVLKFIVTLWATSKALPAHKLRNLAHAVCVVLTVHYQQTPSKVSAQFNAGHGATINHLMLVRSAL